MTDELKEKTEIYLERKDYEYPGYLERKDYELQSV